MSDILAQFLAHPVTFVITMLAWLFVFGYLLNMFFDITIRRLVKKTKTTTDDKMVKLIKRSAFFGIFLFALYIISLYLDIPPDIRLVFNNAFWTVAVVYMAFVAIKVAELFFFELHIKATKNGDENFHTVVPFLKNFTVIGIIAVASLIILKMFEVDITPALASAGVIGIALAFAAKDVIGNLFGGVSVFFDKPYLIGDYVIIADEYRGEVVGIGMRSTKIKTRDNVLLTVPNSVMVTDAVINETGFEPSLRVRIPILVGYDGNLERIEEVLVEVAHAHKLVMKKPHPRVRYREFDDSGVKLELLITIERPADRGVIMHELIKDIHAAFKKHRIKIPYPHRYIEMHKA